MRHTADPCWKGGFFVEDDSKCVLGAQELDVENVCRSDPKEALTAFVLPPTKSFCSPNFNPCPVREDGEHFILACTSIAENTIRWRSRSTLQTVPISAGCS